MEQNEPNSDLDPRDQESAHDLQVLSREVFYKGKNIITQGEEGIRAYYIEQGRVEIIVNEDGHELKISELGEGDIFGEMALINQEPRSATVRALEDCALTVISCDEIESKIKNVGDKAIRKLIHVLAERLSEATKGQMQHYINLAEFQDRVTGMVDRAHVGIDENQRDDFRDEVEPLLNDLQNVLDRYQK